MKTGDLVSFLGKIGLVVGFKIEQTRVHPYYRFWEVLIDGKVKNIEGMNLKVIDENR
jgi:intein/homing endonuclease